jgi:replicative DNA helicase
MTQLDTLLDQPLPDSIENERLLLGAALNDPEAFSQISAILTAEDFSLEKHKRIFLRIKELHERGESIDRITLYNELARHHQVESVDGLSYLVSLDDGLPQLYNLENYCRVVRDKSTLRHAILSAHALIERCLAGGDTPAELLRDAERITEALSASAKRKLNARTVSEIIQDEGGLNQFLSPDSRPGIHIPFQALHETLSGLRRGKLIVLGARPATGKTALATQIAEHAAENGNTVLLVSLEMKGRELLHRSITGRAQVSAYRFRNGRLSLTERASVSSETSALSSLDTRLLIVEDADTTVPAIDALLRSLAARGESAHLCVIDYLQLLSSVGKSENRVQEVSTISRGLKKLAQRFDIPVLALSQLRRSLHGAAHEEPQLDSLKESGQLEQDADQVLFLWSTREPEEGDTQREIKWRVAKNRDGILNRGTLSFYTKFCRFLESAETEAAA